MKNPFKPTHIPMSRPENQSAGILDDHAVRKVLNSIEGTIEKTPANSNDIVNKAYCDSNSLTRIRYTGTDCTGSDGDTSRTLTTTNTPLLIIYGGSVLSEDDHFTISGNEITFIIPVYNEEIIQVIL